MKNLALAAIILLASLGQSLAASTFTSGVVCATKPTPGDPSVTNSWGAIWNTNADLFDASIDGVVTINLPAAAGYPTVVLNDTCGSLDATLSARNAHFVFTGTLTGATTVLWPQRTGVFSVFNNTTGVFSLTICANNSGSCAGTSQTVAQGSSASYVNDGTNVTQRQTVSGGSGITSVAPGASGCLTTSPNPIVTTGTVDLTGGVLSIACGGTGSSTASTARTALGLGAAATENLGAAIVDNGAGNLTIGSGAITAGMLGSAIVGNSALANMSANSVKGNNTGSPATPLDLTQAQLTALINACTSTLKGEVPTPPNNTTTFLRGDCTFATPSGSSNPFTTEATITAAATTDIGSLTSNVVTITGNSTISSFGSSASTTNPIFFVRFQGTPQLTYNATNLILPGAANISISAGDNAVLKYEGSSHWRMTLIWPGGEKPYFGSTIDCSGSGGINKITFDAYGRANGSTCVGGGGGGGG